MTSSTLNLSKKDPFTKFVNRLEAGAPITLAIEAGFSNFPFNPEIKRRILFAVDDAMTCMQSKFDGLTGSNDLTDVLWPEMQATFHYVHEKLGFAGLRLS